MAAAIDAGADDMRDDGEAWEIVSAPDAFQKVLDAVKALGIEPGAAEIAMLPQNYVKLEGKPAQQMVKLMEAAEDHEDTQEGLVERRHRREGDRGLVGVKIFGIDPGSERTGYGCIESIGGRHRLVICGCLSGAAARHIPREAEGHPRRPARAPATGIGRTASPSKTSSTPATSAAPCGSGTRAASPSWPRPRRDLPIARVRARRDQARGRRLRPGREAAGAADGQAAARARRNADAARRRRRAGRRDLPPAQRNRAPSPSALEPNPRGPACAAGGTIVREAVPPSSAPYRGMIARLRGTLVDKGPSRIVVDVGGVGYDVQIPLSTFYPLGEAGSRVELRVHTHVREDALALYGFATPLEHNLFERLICDQRRWTEARARGALRHRARGVDPRGAEPGRGAADQDSRRRQEDGGADRTRVEGSTAGDPRSSNGIHGGRRTTASDLLSALVNLGYQRSGVEKALDRTLAELPQGTFEQLLKAVLKTLSRG